MPSPRKVIRSGSCSRRDATAARSASTRIAPPSSSLSSITSAATPGACRPGSCAVADRAASSREACRPTSRQCALRRQSRRVAVEADEAVDGEVPRLGSRHGTAGDRRPAARVGAEAPSASAAARHLAARAQQLRAEQRARLLAEPARRRAVRARLPGRARARAQRQTVHVDLPPNPSLFTYGNVGHVHDLARMPQIVEATLPWLELQRDRIYVLGSSMGGQETLLLAARYPKALAGGHGKLAGAAAFDAVLRPRRPVRLPDAPPAGRRRRT